MPGNNEHIGDVKSKQLIKNNGELKANDTNEKGIANVKMPGIEEHGISDVKPNVKTQEMKEKLNEIGRELDRIRAQLENKNDKQDNDLGKNSIKNP